MEARDQIIEFRWEVEENINDEGNISNSMHAILKFLHGS